MSASERKSSITKIGPGKIRVRGYDITEIMDKLSYAETVFLVLKGELPTKAEAEIMRAILVSSVDHGCLPHSVIGARNTMAGGNSINAAIAAGVLVIGDNHGGAIEKSAKILQEWAAKEGDINQIAVDLVDWLSENKMRMPGYGHLIHDVDPRTVKLFKLAKKHGFAGRHLELCKAVEDALAEKLGRRLPINIDGGIAAVISDMGFDWRLGKGFFIISRVPGLLAHAYEEMTREKPMRVVGKTDYVYDGPDDREIG